MGTRKPLLRTYILSWYGPFHNIEGNGGMAMPTEY